MRYTYKLFFLLIIISACGDNKTADNAASVKDTAAITQGIKDTLNATGENENATVTRYVLIADTGKAYYSLRSSMYALHKTYNTVIDTMDRFYNSTKHRIVLPEDYEDDQMYAGEYFPRRDLSNTLSIEYLDYYCGQDTENTMALVAGIFENKASADSMLIKIRPGASKAFVLKSDIYVGCMH